ncbi:hypothetical protein [Nocardia crassostreae]|uniref:hypothetical protein n=1 Tax=Nocardia crassostreae TaxID=53428 RepID=UPI0008379509|nr:hypothetical protein [Nocardia crassostreae]
MPRYALVAAGILFLLYPVLRPWEDETTTDGAYAALSSTGWVISHLCAMIGFILVSLALYGLRDRIGSGPVITTWIGAALVLPYYGAEDFGLHAAATEGSRAELVDVTEGFRYLPIAAAMFAAGLIALGAGAVWVAIALRTTAAIVYAVGFALYLPQFFLPAAGRIAHGVLMLAGCVWLGSTVMRETRTTAPSPS